MGLGTIDDDEFQRWASQVSDKINTGQVKRDMSKTFRRVGTQSLRTLKANTPVDTGGLRRAWTAGSPHNFGGGWILELTNNKEYASYVERGHRQTPGRFVPKIKKRLKASWVPGQFFMKRSSDQINKQLPEMIEPSLWVLRDLFND